MVSKLTIDRSFDVCRTEHGTPAPQRGNETSRTSKHLAALSRLPALELYNASAKSPLVDGAGDWSEAEICQCREVINADDLDSADGDDTALERHTIFPAIDPHSTRPPNVGWMLRNNSWSSVETVDSVDSEESDPSAEVLGAGPAPHTHELANFCPGPEEADEITADVPTNSQRVTSPGDSPMGSDQELLNDDCGQSMLSTAESTYTGSILMPDYSDETPAPEDGHHHLLVTSPTTAKGTVLALQSGQQRQHGNSDGSSPGNPPTAARGGRSNPSSRKRQRANSGRGGREGDDQEGDDSQRTPEKPSKPFKEGPKRGASLACPFFKKDPLKHRNCYKYTLNRIQDVKQHLLRRHIIDFYCPLCLDTFSDEDKRDNHIRAQSCVKVPFVPFDGVTKAQKGKLKNKVPSKLSAEAQWFTIFEILFPGFSPQPKSAYADAEFPADVEIYQSFTNVQGPNIILEHLHRSGILPPNSENNARNLQVIGDGLQDIAGLYGAAIMRSEPTVPPLALGTTDDSQWSTLSSETLNENFQEPYAAEQSRSRQAQFSEQAEGEGLGRAQPTHLYPHDAFMGSPQVGDITGPDTAPGGQQESDAYLFPKHLQLVADSESLPWDGGDPPWPF